MRWALKVILNQIWNNMQSKHFYKGIFLQNPTIKQLEALKTLKVPKCCSNQFQLTWGSNSLMWYCPCGWTLEVFFEAEIGRVKLHEIVSRICQMGPSHHITSKLWSNSKICKEYVWMCNDSDLTQLISVRVGIFRSLQRIKVTPNPLGPRLAACSHIGTLRGKKHSAPWRESLWLLPENCCWNLSIWTQI